MPNTRTAGLAHARTLAENGELPAAVRMLCDASMETEAAELVDARVLRLLARHQHTELIQAVDALPAPARSPLARLACLDTKVLGGRADTAELNDLIEEARQQGQHDLVSFGTAVLVEQLMLHSDPVAVLIAMQQLTTLPQDALPGTLVLIARARLLRACSLARLFLGPAGFQDADADRASAVADFNRAGWQVDRWLTTSSFHLVRAGVSWAADPADRFATLEARDQLIAAGSEQVPWARYAVAVTAFAHGDVGAVQAEVDLISNSGNDRLSFLGLLADHLDALITLALLPFGQSSDAAVERLTALVGRVRHEYPLFIGPMLVQTTHALIDAGRAEDAQAWFGRVQALNPVLAHERHEREVMACRIALLGGRDDSWMTGDTSALIAGRLEAALRALADLGQLAMARSMALRSAVNARRAGLHDLADQLLAWARAHTAGAGPTTWWDIRAERQVSRPAISVVTGPIVTDLRLLTPVAHVEVNGQPQHLAPALLRLIAVLGALERPVGTEELIDLLWPDLGLAAGRGRIKSAHHRLRQALSPAPELVRRDGDVWSLDTTGAWQTDLAQFHRLAAGDRAERLVALRMPQGLLWHAQFPYDEALAERRSWLEARWLNLAQELADSPGVAPGEIHRIAERLGLGDAQALFTGEG